MTDDRDALRAGKRFLKERNGSAAMVRFEKALMLSKALGNKVCARKAGGRGTGMREERRRGGGEGASVPRRGSHAAWISKVLPCLHCQHTYTSSM